MKNIIRIPIIGLTVSLIFFSFCSKNEDLTLEILNTSIISSNHINDKNIKNIVRFDNYILDSVVVNKIDIKLTNNGTKKYVLFIGKIFDYTENDRIDNALFKVFKDDEDFQPTRFGGSGQHNSEDFYYRKEQNQKERILLKKELNEIYLKEKISLEKINFQDNMNFVVIHPGETKFFSYYKTLPVYQDDYGSYYYYKFLKNENYFVQVSLKNDIETSKKNFSSNQIKEIETNGYTVFNGTISSNKVPIKFVDMNKK